MQHALGLPRVIHRATAWALLLAVSVTTLGPVLHDAHDAELRPIVVVHDERHHHYEAAPEPASGALDSEHCVACHFARSFRGPASWVVSGRLRFSTSTPLPQVTGEIPAFAGATPRPSRAPPLA